MKYIFYFTFILFLFSCKKDYPDYLGSSLDDQFGDLFVLDSLSPNSSEFNFSNNSKNFFNASWSKNLQWVLKITGDSTGAVKTLTGFDSKLDLNNSQWIGSADDFPSFNFENCTAELNLSDGVDQIVLTTSVSISSLKPIQNGLSVIADFDNGYPKGHTDSAEYVQPGANMNFKINYGGAAQGEGFYSMGGYVTWDYYLGSLKIGTDVSALQDVAPSLVYFNMAIKGGVQGEVPADQYIKVICTEEDGDTYFHDFAPVNWEQWRLNSIPYDLFTSGASQANNIKEPSTISQIEIMCLSCPAGGDGPILNGGEPCLQNENLIVQTSIDYITFTTNEPFLP
jgi:hypothetical protein